MLAIWSVSAVASLPGLAVSPILGDLNKIFPKATDLEIQLLTSLPSLLVIPFVLLSGRLSVGRNKFRVLVTGLALFFVSGLASLFSRSMGGLIAMSCLLGVGAGMVIPFSTGLVVDYFSGKYRIRQLGYSSAISNLTLVVATALAGYLADVDWHLPFLVYTLPGLSLVLVRMRLRPEARSRNAGSPTRLQQVAATIDRRRLSALMLLYFFITYAVLAIVFYGSFLVEHEGYGSSFSGVLLSIFFLAVMLPGLFIDPIIRCLQGWSNLVALAAIGLGLVCFGVFHARSLLLVGAVSAGLGYGIMQPVIYDKAARLAPLRSATFALSLVMSMNYLAVMACPFIVDLFRRLSGMHGERFPFLFNALCVAAVWAVAWMRRGGFALGGWKSHGRE